VIVGGAARKTTDAPGDAVGNGDGAHGWTDDAIDFANVGLCAKHKGEVVTGMAQEERILGH